MSRQRNQLYEFGEFQLDVAERVLRRGERPVPLKPKVFETLLVLVRHGGHLLEKDELMKQVWADAVVEEANLARNIWTKGSIITSRHFPNSATDSSRRSENYQMMSLT